MAFSTTSYLSHIKLFQTQLQRLPPVWYGNSEYGFNFCLVEDGVAWAFNLGRELVTMARPDVADIAALAAYLHGEVIPRADSLVRVMVDTLPVQLPIRSDLVDECRLVSCISGCAHLVEDRFQAVLLGGQMVLRLDGVRDVRRIRPGRPEYHISAA